MNISLVRMACKNASDFGSAFVSSKLNFFMHNLVCTENFDWTTDTLGEEIAFINSVNRTNRRINLLYIFRNCELNALKLYKDEYK